MPAREQSRVPVTPMKAMGIHHQVERTYRETGPHQWVRETYMNAIEAGATRIEYGIEWQAVAEQRVYRRLIADNGSGMPPEDLVGFFNTWGGGGKPIGGVHENFGIGAKSSLLPWNQYGMVVISWYDGEAAMIWLTTDPESGEYGLRNFEVVDEESEEEEQQVYLDEVVMPFPDAEHGCNWAAVKPDWIEDHGTVIVLLGSEPSEDTVVGDPNRDESDIKGMSTYLNRRLWEIPSGVHITVDELRTQDITQWPLNEAMAHGPHRSGGPDRRTNTRTIQGAKKYIRYDESSFKAGKLAASGSLPVSDGTVIDWFLWKGDRPAVQSYASLGGYIAALYKNELYDVSNHQATYRSFGITESSVRTKLWLIIRPPMLEESRGRVKRGVYPRGDRNSLLIQGGPHPGDPLPMNEWGAEFADNMPAEILDALRAARTGASGTIKDERWRERLADRFGSRWRILKFRAQAGGGHTVNPSQLGSLPRAVKRAQKTVSASGGTGGTAGGATISSTPGAVPAVRKRVAGGIPTYDPVRADQVGQGMLAAWQPNHPEHPEGVVLINVDHPVLEEEIAHWQSQYPDHLAEEVRVEVIAVYGELAVAKVAHSEHLKAIIPASTVENQLRSEEALTMALLGLIGEEAVIAPRIGGKFRKRRVA